MVNQERREDGRNLGGVEGREYYQAICMRKESMLNERKSEKVYFQFKCILKKALCIIDLDDLIRKENKQRKKEEIPFSGAVLKSNQTLVSHSIIMMLQLYQ